MRTVSSMPEYASCEFTSVGSKALGFCCGFGLMQRTKYGFVASNVVLSDISCRRKVNPVVLPPRLDGGDVIVPDEPNGAALEPRAAMLPPPVPLAPTGGLF